MKKKLTLKKIKITELSELEAKRIKGATGGTRPTDPTTDDYGCDGQTNPPPDTNPPATAGNGCYAETKKCGDGGDGTGWTRGCHTYGPAGCNWDES